MESKDSTFPNYQKLCQYELLERAWKKVKAKNTAGGVDHTSVKGFAKGMPGNLQSIQIELIERSYVPDPYLTVFIPKNKSEKRRLGLLTVRDKIVQQAILLLLSPYLDPQFLNTSYGYRPEKGPVKAVKRLWHIIHQQKQHWLVKLDFDNFFDNIPHLGLLEKLQALVQDVDLVKLIELCLKMGSIERNLDWTDRLKGVPQGGLLSPILSNVYLHQLDVFTAKNKINYLRYADDFVLLTENEIQAKAIQVKVENFIKKELYLPLNKGARISHLKEGIEFLGIQFYDRQYGLSVEKLKKLKAKLSLGLSLKDGYLKPLYTQTIQGICNYYGKLISADQLMPLDVHTRYRLNLEIQKNKRHFRTQKSIRLALEGLYFFSPVFQAAQKDIVKALTGSQRKNALSRMNITVDHEKAIRLKKKKYQELQSAAIELTIQQAGVFIGRSRGRITVKKRGRNILRVPTAQVKYISIFSQGVLISSDLVQFCADQDIPIDFFKNNGKLSARLYDPVSPDESLWQEQLRALKDDRGLQLAKTWVYCKISNQINLLKYYHKSRKKENEFCLAFEKNKILMEQIRDTIKTIDNKTLVSLRAQLMGKEGSAGAAYWSVVKFILPASSNFKNRHRRGASDLVNVLLNYGYGMLYSRIWDALIRARLNPYISYLHSRQTGKPTLSFDMIEEFRQVIVDKIVFGLINKGHPLVIKNGQLAENTRRLLVSKILEKLNSFESFRGQKKRLSDILRQQALSLAMYFKDSNYTYKPYRLKW